MWEREHAPPEVVANSWRNQGLMEDLGDVNGALKKGMDVLHPWGSRKFGNVTRELERLRAKLTKLYEEDAAIQDIHNTLDDMNELLYREEMLWLQQSRISWLKEGDRNTKFFHHKAIWRARKNRIKSLQDQDGIAQDTPG
jgi:hypothetical protein